MRTLAIAAVTASALLTSGCMAYRAGRATVKAVTFPVRAGAKVVDWSTTSRAEADRNRGRKVREAEERAHKAARAKRARSAKGERGM